MMLFDCGGMFNPHGQPADVRYEDGCYWGTCPKCGITVCSLDGRGSWFVFSSI